MWGGGVGGGRTAMVFPNETFFLTFPNVEVTGLLFKVSSFN